MRLFLNDLSIPENVDDSESVYRSLVNLIEMAEAAKSLSNKKPVRRHKDIKYKQVMPGVSMIEFIINLGKSSDPKKRDAKQLLLELLTKAPFLNFPHEDGSAINEPSGQCLKNTCFNEASSCRTGAGTLSIDGEVFKSEFIDIVSSLFGTCKVLNLTSVEQIKNLAWNYDENEKHRLKEDKFVDGEKHSAMLLSSKEAQFLLTNGVKFGKSVFNRLGEQWYKFHCHDKSWYHGFPIDVQTSYKEFSAAQILFNNIGQNEEGQIFGDMIAVRTTTI